MSAIADTRDVYLGRIGLPTLDDTVTEQLGSQVSSVGDSAAVGQRKAKGFTLNLLVKGINGQTPVELGNRMRRQVRSLMQNSHYRLAGVYLRVGPDPEMNGWLVIGEGELSYDDGGVTFGNYKLSLSQAFLVATQRTHRDGYRVDLTDLRLTTSWVDTLAQVVNTEADFAGLGAFSLTALPVAAYDRAVQSNAQPAVATRQGSDGACALIVGFGTGDVVSWERDEDDFNKGDVVIYDRRGNTDALPSP